MRLAPTLAFAFALTGAAQAQTPMTAEEFAAFSTGQTLDYFIDGTFWGSERHLADRKTLDADAEGACREGEWFPKGEQICFVYAGEAGEHCWQFFRDGSRVLAQTDDGSLSTEVTLADQPLACPGPDVGV